MNILFITYKIGGTASGKISARVANELSIKGHKVYVVTESVHDSQKVHEDIILSECRNYIKESSFLSRVRIKILTLLKYSAYNSNFIWRIRAYLKSRDIITNNKIDWIIARTTPIDSCLVGLKLKEKTHIKLYSHFSDPLPPPSEKNKKIRRRFYTETGKIISQSDLISFGTQQMYNYIQSMFEYNFSNKTFVSPDVTDTDTQIELKRDESNKVVKLLFLGNIYGNRNPNELFAAIKEINDEGIIQCYISICSSVPKDVVFCDQYVNYCGYRNDIFEAMATADILVDIDMDELPSLYMSSKLKDYLIVNRPILSITPVNSPSYNLLYGKSSCWTIPNDREMIRQAIKDILQKKNISYSDRSEAIRCFSSKYVVSNIVDQLLLKDEN